MADIPDPQSEALLQLLEQQEKIKTVRIPGVRTVLVVLSSRGMVYDIESLRQKIQQAYREAAVFFRTTGGHAIGSVAPSQYDLLVDFTGPRQMQGLFYAQRLRRGARVAVGRNAGLFRKRIYDRVFDEKTAVGLPVELFARERKIQKEVLALAGVALELSGEVSQDRGKSIGLELSAMVRR